jgi:hypothetical protein
LYLRQTNISGLSDSFLKGTSLPFEIDRLDDKSKGWADGGDILAHDPLDDGRLARVVQAAGFSLISALRRVSSLTDADSQHQDSHLLILQPGLSQYRQHIGYFQYAFPSRCFFPGVRGGLLKETKRVGPKPQLKFFSRSRKAAKSQLPNAGASRLLDA